MKNFKSKTIKLKIEYTFKIRYEHPSHFKEIKKQLMEDPINYLGGAGIVGTDEGVYSYSCERIGKGKVT